MNLNDLDFKNSASGDVNHLYVDTEHQIAVIVLSSSCKSPSRKAFLNVGGFREVLWKQTL